MASAQRQRLSTRVILSTLASGALGGVLASVVTVVAVDRLVTNHGDTRLSGATSILEGEILEGFEERDWEPLAEVVDDENGELVTSGIRLAVFSSGHRIAGDPWVPEVPPGNCESRGVVGRRVRACGRRYDDWVLVAASVSDEPRLRLIYATASAGALVCGGLAAAFASARLARWALRPLSDLERAIRRMRADAPDSSGLLDDAPQDQCVEVALIREALSDLVGRVHALLDPAQRFAAQAAHELRTPLTTLRGEIDLLVEDTRDPPTRQALLRVSERARHLAELVERLLVLASPIDEEQASVETLSLCDVLDDVLASLSPSERARIRVDAGSEALTRGEPSLLEVMLRNALDNALRYSGSGAVDVSLREDERGLVVLVRDRGPGIAPSLRKRVFEPFFRLERRDLPGHGLGLSLIGHIVRAHGGTAAFVDVADGGGGACLRLELPSWQPMSRTPV